MGPVESLPDSDFQPGGPFSDAFLAHGCGTTREAAGLVWSLPYGRNSDAGDPLCVLSEGRGTCSTKHALLKRLFDEMDIDVDLRVGIYAMTELNTPGVGPVLARFGLESLPEAHCYLVSSGHVVDITRKALDAEPIKAFLVEERIRADQIGAFKREFHRGYLAEWIGAGGGGGRTLDAVWAIREACIAALGEDGRRRAAPRR